MSRAVAERYETAGVRHVQFRAREIETEIGIAGVRLSTFENLRMTFGIVDEDRSLPT